MSGPRVTRPHRAALYTQYKQIESGLQQNRIRLGNKLPEIRRALDTVRLLCDKARRCKLNPVLKAPDFSALQLKYDTLLSSFAFSVNLRPYHKQGSGEELAMNFELTDAVYAQATVKAGSEAPCERIGARRTLVK